MSCHISFTSWLRRKRKTSGLPNLLKSYIEEDWWPQDGKTLSDFLQAGRKRIPAELIVFCFTEYKNEIMRK